MITAQAQSVNNLLMRYKQLKTDQKTEEALLNRVAELRNAVAPLKKPAEQTAFLANHKWLDRRDIPASDIAKVGEYVTKIRETLESDTDGINRTMSYLTKKLTAVVEKLEEVSETAWMKRVEECKPPIDEKLLKQVEQQHQSEYANVAKIRVMAKDKIDEHAPVNPDQLAQIENHWIALGDLLAKLPKPTDNPEVKRFLDAIRRGGGAPLELLTDTVRQYLKDQGWSDSYKIYHAR